VQLAGAVVLVTGASGGIGRADAQGPTRVLAEQTSAVDPQRLGESAGHLGFEELRQVDAALRLVLGL
jgi:NAD(P)-dependent dehydrogenase (short-subunit alcohol dehydrogenase family)